ncbi:MAG: lysozyme, partial [Pseudomonadota bacterium]
AAEQFIKWNHAGGVALDGLTRRRQAERQLFLKDN